MTIRSISATFALAALAVTACTGAKERSPGEVLSQDSALAGSVRQADTSAYSEAADVAMAFDPDSARPTPGTVPTPGTQPAVPMRVKPAATQAGASPPARAPMRPAPATIHPEPIPQARMTPAPAPARAPAREPELAPPVTESPSSAATLLREREPCASPAAPDQRRCLLLHLSRSDVTLDRNYQALIASMKREAGTPAGAKEPESVQQLRVAQRAWLVYRDTECRRRNRGREGPLWAPTRAQCLGEFSAQRAEELAKALARR